GLAVDGDPIRLGHGDRRTGQHLAVDCDPPARDQALGFAPRAEARAGDPLGHALGSGGSGAHEPRHAAIRASNRASSAAEMPYSGCHCTPMQKRRPGTSIASITPSGARPLTTTPGPVAPAA